MEAIDAMGRRYGVLPSTVLGVLDPLKAGAIDLHAFNAGVVAEARAAAKARWEANRRG